MIFSKKFRKTAASVLALVMVFAMSTGAFADASYGEIDDVTATSGYYNVSVSYTVTGELPTGAQISIIALDGEDSVQFEQNSNTATNVLWIDQQPAGATGTFEFQVDASKVSGTGFHVKSGITGGETLPTGWVKIATQAPEVPKSDDATLKTLTVGGENVDLDHTAGTGSIILGANAASVAVVATKNHSAATVTGDGTVDLKVGDNEVKITVTAEDGTQKVYTITITNPAAQGGGGEGGDEDAPVIPEYDPEHPENGGLTVNNGISSSEMSAPLGVENGKVVRISGIQDLPVDSEGVPTKTPVVGDQEFYYTEYDADGDGKTEIKFVTIITSENVTSADVTWENKAPTKLVYMDVNNDGSIDTKDVGALIPMGIGIGKPTDIFGLLKVDLNGDGIIDTKDVGAGIPFGLDANILPDAAKK